MPKRAGEKRVPGGKRQQTLEVLNDAGRLARPLLYIINVALSLTPTVDSGREARVVRVTRRPEEDTAVEGYQKLPTPDGQEPRAKVDQHFVRARHGELPKKCNVGFARLLALRPTRGPQAAVAVRASLRLVVCIVYCCSCVVVCVYYIINFNL